MNEVVFEVLVVGDEDEALLLAVVTSEAVAVLVETVDDIDDAVLTVVVTDVVDDVSAVESVVTVADSEVVVPADVVPSEVWAAVVIAPIDDWVVTPVFISPDGRSTTQITPTNRIVIRTAAMGTKAVLPNFNYCSTIRNNLPGQDLYSQTFTASTPSSIILSPASGPMNALTSSSESFIQT